MLPTLSQPAPVSLKPPHRLDQILATFGDIFAYLRSDHTLDPRWQKERLATVSLPFAMPLSWDRSRAVSRMTGHRLLVPIFQECFQNIAAQHLQEAITSFGGCFSFRSQRTGTRLSTHAWGIAIDLNPETNPQGSAGNMHPGIISIFRNAGFAWGGDWSGIAADPMHFQFCTGY